MSRMTIKKNDFAILRAFAISILCSAVLTILGVGTAYTDLMEIGLFAYAFILIYKRMPEFLLKYLFFIVGGAWAIVAVYLMENGDVFLRGRHSEHYNSLPPYVLAWAVFFFVLSCFEIRRKSRKKTKATPNYEDIELPKKYEKQIRLFTIVLILLITICFALVIKKPYFILEIDRFVYQQNEMPKLVSFLLPWLYAFIPIILMERKYHRWIVYCYCLIFGLLLVWTGEKFTGIFMLLYILLLSINPNYVSKEFAARIKQIVRVSAGIVAAILIIVYLQQTVLIHVDFIGFKKYLLDRIAAQGELWWLAFQKDVGKGLHLKELWDELGIIIYQPQSSNMMDYNFGIYKMMWKFMDKNWVKSALTYGLRATESTRVTFFYYGKYIGLIFGQVCMALVVYYIVNLCVDYCNRTRFFEAVLGIYVLRNVISAFSMSDFQFLTTKRIILIYCIMIALKHIRYTPRLRINGKIKKILGQ